MTGAAAPRSAADVSPKYFITGETLARADVISEITDIISTAMGAPNDSMEEVNAGAEARWLHLPRMAESEMARYRLMVTTTPRLARLIIFHGARSRCRLSFHAIFVMLRARGRHRRWMPPLALAGRHAATLQEGRKISAAYYFSGLMRADANANFAARWSARFYIIFIFAVSVTSGHRPTFRLAALPRSRHDISHSPARRARQYAARCCRNAAAPPFIDS